MNSPHTSRAALKAPEFHQVSWDERLAAHVARLAADWFLEDLAHER
jgi:hypothetical protein